jgi:gamma-glutamylcyclotransferase (GGCT)/AIG2-like uncharacterized protein YtfP
VNSKIPQTEIQGEVFEVSCEEVLLWLDELEGHPDVYLRTSITALLEGEGASEGGATATPVPVQIYFNDRAATEGEGVEAVPSGSFRDSDSAKNHLTEKNIDNFRIPWSEIEQK